MTKRLVTDQDEIERLLLADPAFTEAVHRDTKGVYIMGGNGSRRYITQLGMVRDNKHGNNNFSNAKRKNRKKR